MKNQHCSWLSQMIILCFFCCASMTLIAQSSGSGKGKKSGARIQSTNWGNSMGCTFENDDCVALAEDDLLWFKLVVRFADPFIGHYPDMYFHFYFPDYLPGIPYHGHTDKVTPDIVEPTVLETGDSAWQASFFFEIDLSKHCTRMDSFFFAVEYQLRTLNEDGMYIPYPIGAYPDLFPPDTFNVDPTGFAPFIETEKMICCNGEVYPCEEDEDIVTRQAAPSLGLQKETNGLATQLQIFPNPFSNNATIQLNSEEEVALVVYDLNGKVVFQKPNLTLGEAGVNQDISTSDWPAGMYFFRFSSQEETVLRKLVKGHEE